MPQYIHVDKINGAEWPQTVGEYGQILQSTGTAVQWVNPSAASLDPPLQSITNLTTSGNEILYTTSADTYATSSITALSRSLLAESTALNWRSILGLTIGSDVQAYDNSLNSLSNLVTTSNQMLYTTGSEAFATTSLTPFARTLLDDTDAATMRNTLSVVASAGSSIDNTIIRFS